MNTVPRSTSGRFEKCSACGADRTLSEVLNRTAYAGLTLQRDDGSFAPGHNGPHRDPEQPVRNTGHWLITLLAAHRATGDDRFVRAAESAARYLKHPDRRPGGFSIHHRDTPGKDRCNGLMGPAFSIESLACAAMHKNDQGAWALARHLVDQHGYDEDVGLWRIREIDGSEPGIDWTINHQIWFASAAAVTMQATGGRGLEQVEDFLNRLPTTMELRGNGRVAHVSPAALSRRQRVRRAFRVLDAEARQREIAYHFFNLYPLAILREVLPSSTFWGSRQLRRMRSYENSDEYQRAASDPSFVQPYCPAGFPFSFGERVFVDQVFGPSDLDVQQHNIGVQISRTLDVPSMLFTKGSIDPVTQAARAYELTRLQDVALPFCAVCSKDES